MSILISRLFEGFNYKLSRIPSSYLDAEPVKFNESLSFTLNNLEKFKMFSEKDNLSSKNHYKLRIITDENIKIGHDYQNLLEKKKPEVRKEINFFGLLLRVSKDLLTPSSNLIFHINGGEFVSQSSNSHYSYLSR